MAALAALTSLWILTAAPQARPLLIDVSRFEVPATVRTFAVAATGSWYLIDPEHDAVIRRVPDGSESSTVGGYGWSLSALDHPAGVATDGNRVYVADRGNHRIVSYDRSLRPLGTFETRDTTDLRARFGYPEGVAVSGRGDLIVLDGESGEIVGFRPDRRVAFRLGREMTGGTPLRDPSCLRVDDTACLLVGESGGVRAFDLFGNELVRVPLSSGATLRGVAGSPQWFSAVSADTLYVIDRESTVVHRWPRSSMIPGLPLGELWDVAWHDGDLLVLASGLVIAFRLEK